MFFFRPVYELRWLPKDLWSGQEINCATLLSLRWGLNGGRFWWRLGYPKYGGAIHSYYGMVVGFTTPWLLDMGVVNHSSWSYKPTEPILKGSTLQQQGGISLKSSPLKADSTAHQPSDWAGDPSSRVISQWLIIHHRYTHLLKIKYTPRNTLALYWVSFHFHGQHRKVPAVTS